MKKHSSRLLALGALFGLAFIPVAAIAAEFRTGDAPSHSSGETITDDLYLVGGSITSSGAVRGDLAAMGGNILINGPISGDLAAGGGTVTVLSDIGDDVRIGGGTVVIQGAVAGDVLVGGGQVTISSSQIGGDLAIGGGMVRIDAQVTGDVRIGGGDVRINSTIGGNVEIQAENIVLGPKALIEGTLSYKSPQAAVLESGAVVRGETIYSESPNVREAAKLGLVAFFSVWFVAKMLMVFAGALVVAYVFQRYAAELVARATQKPFAQLGRGLVTVIVLPVVSVLLLFTVVGIAFGVLGLLSFFMLMIFASMITPLVIGSVVHKLVFKPVEYEINWMTVLLGTVLYFVIGMIPFLGWIVILAAMLVSIGAALSIKTEIASEWR